MQILLANLENLEEVSKLFDRYRVFYQQSTDLEAARKFIEARFHQHDSTIFIARDNDIAIGFTQLYPSYDYYSRSINTRIIEKSH